MIDLWRGSASAADYVSSIAGDLLLHPVVEAELLSGARDSRHLSEITSRLEPLRRAAIRNTDFVLSLELLRGSKLSGGTSWPDCLIAATCVRLGCQLATLNDKHFRSIRGLRVRRPY